jgi:hypothetical protein
MRGRCKKIAVLRWYLISVVGAVLITGVSVAQENVDFKRYKSSRTLILDNCDILDGHTRIAIKGGYLALPTDKRLGAIKLPARFRFFGCGLDSTGATKLFAKRTLGDDATQLNISMSQFKEVVRDGLEKGCNKVSGWPSGLIYKTVGSDHFSAGDPRKNTIGLIAKPGASVYASGCTEMVDSQGNVVARFGLYSTNDGWKFRAYSAVGCGGSGVSSSSVANQALKNTRSTDVFVKFGDNCYGPIDPRQCIGSQQC